MTFTSVSHEFDRQFKDVDNPLRNYHRTPTAAVAIMSHILNPFQARINSTQKLQLLLWQYKLYAHKSKLT